MGSVSELVQRTERMVGLVEAQQRRVRSLTREVAELETESSVLTMTTATLDRLLQMLQAEAVGKVEQLVTHGLQVVFPDQKISFRFEVTTKFRAPWLEPRLIHNGVEGPILDAFGGGPASVAAFILRVVVISRMNLAPLILLDEPFAWVSQEYVDRVGVLLKDLCKSLGLTIVMVSHQTAFLQHADRAYQAEGDSHGSSGTVFTRIVGTEPDSADLGGSPTTS